MTPGQVIEHVSGAVIFGEGKVGVKQCRREGEAPAEPVNQFNHDATMRIV
jgi:hypothetical protein